MNKKITSASIFFALSFFLSVGLIFPLRAEAVVSVTKQIISGVDDAEQSSYRDTVYTSSDQVSTVSGGWFSNSYQGGYRFVLDASIPQGSVITSAYLQVYVYDGSYDDVEADIYFQKEASTESFVEGSYSSDISDRPKTEAKTSWVATPLGTGWKDSPSLVDPLQELVNSYTITDFVVITVPHSFGSSNLKTISYDNNSAQAAKIYIEYEGTDLSVAKSGLGSGTITSDPSGIDCGSTCSSDFIEDEIVTLSAEADADSSFVGWFGEGCSGTGDCVVTMDSDKLVEAKFDSNNFAKTSGYAWSENIGWISFSCENESSCGSSDYGVYINETTGDLVGYAWSENIGWIDFSPSGPYPDLPDSSAAMDLGTGDVSGWAKVLSAEDDPDDGWDGWIKLAGSNYEVTFDAGASEFFGHAWSDSVVGWISFNCLDGASCATSDYQVTAELSTSPNITDLTHNFSSPCSQSRIPTFSWETDATLPYDYDLRICSDAACSNELVYEEKRSTSSKSWSPSCTYCCNVSPYNGVSFDGGAYYTQIRVSEAGEGSWSDWEEETFTTYNHCYPYPGFLCDGGDCETMQIYEETVVELSSNSTTYDGELSCSWELPGIATVEEGDHLSDCSIKVIFSAPPPGERNQEITMTVTDTSGFFCPVTETLEIRFPLPEYREISPAD